MAGARGLWLATGMKDEDFGKPIIVSRVRAVGIGLAPAVAGGEPGALAVMRMPARSDSGF
jgi:hypothetical protein